MRPDNFLKPYSSVTRLKCDLCPARFVTAGNLWRHVCAEHQDDEDDEGRLVCDRAGCGRKFDSLSALSAHWMLHLGASTAYDWTQKRSEADRCELCGRMFGDQAALYRHMDARHPEWRRDGQCNVCGRHVGVDVHAVLAHSIREHCSVRSAVVVAAHGRPALRSGPLRSRVQRHVHRNQLPYQK